MPEKRSIPVWAAVVAGWLCAFLPLFVRGRGGFLPPETPSMPAGVDLRMMLEYSRAWLEVGTPFVGLNPYPPLSALLFAPLSALPFSAAYGLMTAMTLMAFASVAVVLPLLAFPRADRRAVLGVALSGALSYGLWFELRRGQFNVAALACAALGLFLFHRGKGRGARWAAYALFSASIQLKLFPAIFVFAFAEEARAWRSNLARWAALGAANVALLFALGPEVFADFRESLKAQAEGPFTWAGNHSIQSFAEWAGHPGIAPALFATFAACFAIASWRTARTRGGGTFAGLVLMGALGTMLLPGVSHDYKLTAFPMAFAFFVAAAEPMSPPQGLRGICAAGLLAALCFLEAWTLFSFAAKPEGLRNNAPFLLVACMALAAWMACAGRRSGPAADRRPRERVSRPGEFRG